MRFDINILFRSGHRTQITCGQPQADFFRKIHTVTEEWVFLDAVDPTSPFESTLRIRVDEIASVAITPQPKYVP